MVWSGVQWRDPSAYCEDLDWLRRGGEAGGGKMLLTAGFVSLVTRGMTLVIEGVNAAKGCDKQRLYLRHLVAISGIYNSARHNCGACCVRGAYVHM